MIVLATLAVLTMDGGATAPATPLTIPLDVDAERKIEGLQFTGETAECIGNDSAGRSMQLKKTIALDDFHILFEMEDGSFFLNEISSEKGCKGSVKYGIGVKRKATRSYREGICSGDKAVVYRTSRGSDVFSNQTTTYSFCKIGEFHRLVSSSEVATPSE